MNTPIKPTPQITELSRPYWEAAAEGRLVLQCCAGCGKVRHYPQLLCNSCYSDSASWTTASGHGKVHSWTIAYHAFHPAFAADLPYTLVTVDLDEGVRALGLWRGEVALSLGQAVQGRFEAREGGVDLVFVPLPADGAADTAGGI